ncbi:hypothetical protein KAI87_12850, partial [Myxococcota bacterium]|nr:hypothetical protein [Myxococcota bacterium]
MTEGDSKERSKITMDTFWEGALKVWQPAKGQGYRFNLDPVLLYGFAPPANEILEFGAGCGILSLLMLGSAKTQKAVAVEIQAQL